MSSKAFLDELKEKLAKTEIDIETLESDINKAAVIGLNVKELQDKLKARKSQIELIKSTYKIE